MSAWKLFHFNDGGPLLVNTSLIESARPDPKGTRLYAPEAGEREYYLVREPFELVVAMLTGQVDDAGAKADIAYLIEAYNYGQFADDMLDHPDPDCRSPCKPLREALWRHLDRLARE